jgi:hypothetical protein
MVRLPHDSTASARQAARRTLWRQARDPRPQVLTFAATARYASRNSTSPIGASGHALAATRFAIPPSPAARAQSLPS